VTTVGSDFVARLADRAAEAEKLRRLPSATVDDYRESGLARLLLPARYGGRQAEFPEIFDVVRRMAHGCASSAWTLGFYTLHNWMLALFCERARTRYSPTGRCCAPRRSRRPGEAHRSTVASG
jgi:alkylation response protein AidB-like acyl-CoA dehydrogenase